MQTARLSLLLLAASCSTLTEHARSKIDQDEQIRLAVQSHAPDEAPAVRLAALPQPRTPTDPRIADLLRDRLSLELSTVMRSPPAEWGGSIAAPCLATAPRPVGDRGAIELRPAVRGFSIERRARGAFATRLRFSLQPVDGLLRIVWDDALVEYSRAPVRDASWNTWWTRFPLIYGFGFDVARLFGSRYGDAAIDLRVDVLVHAAWTDGSGNAHRAIVGAAKWTLLDVPLGGPVVAIDRAGGWLALPPPSAVVGADGSVSPGQVSLLFDVVVTEHDDLRAAYGSVRRISESLFEQTFYGVR